MNERWAKRRDELVEASWLRDLRSRRMQRKPGDPARMAKDPLRAKVPGGGQRVAAAER